jgi:hypothetical protein
LAALAGVALAIGPASAQVVLNQFNTDAEVSNWRFDFGGVAHSAVFDGMMDADGSTVSGSMKVTLTFDTTLGGNNKGAYTRDINPALDGALLQRLQMDVFVDPASVKDAYGNYGYFSLVVRNGPTYVYNSQANANLGPAGQWIHFDTALSGAVDSLRAVTWQLYGGPSQNMNGDVILWIDNLVFTQKPATSAPPALVLLPVIPGLEIAASLGDIFQRQDIRTKITDYSWLAPLGIPATYTLTITNFPDPAYKSFEAHVLLVGNNPSPGSYGDYNEANVVDLRMLNNPGGSGYPCELRYKVAAPGSSIFNGPLVTSFVTPTILGTWSMTLDGTTATVLAPDGTTRSGTFGDEVLTAFYQSTAVYIGIIPNAAANIGQSAVFSGASVTGAGTDLAEDFSTLDNWVPSVALDPGGVILVPVGAIRKLTWPVSAAGFTLHSIDLLAEAPTWPLSVLQVRTIGTNQVTILGPDPGNRFFRLEKP